MLVKSGPLRYWWAFVLAGALAAVALIRLVIGQSHSDLEVYRFGVDALWSGRDLYGALPLADAGIPLPFIYPPFAAIVLTPLAALPLGWAVVLLFAVNLLSLGVTLFAVLRSWWPWRGALAVTGLATPAALLLEPVRGTFGYGQINLPLMVLVAADCLLFRGRYRGIGIAAAVKLTPMAFVLFFLVRRDFRATLTAFATFGVATGLGFLVAPAASAHYWFNGLAGASGVSGTSFHTNQTLQAVLARFGVDAGQMTVWWLLASALLLVLVVLVMRRLEAAPALLLNATFALLISPTSWSHHWVWIAPGLVLVLAFGVRTWPWPGAAWFGLAGALGALFVLAPFRYYPAFDRPGLEWSASQRWLGNSYVAVGLLTVLVTSAAVLRSRTRGVA